MLNLDLFHPSAAILVGKTGICHISLNASLATKKYTLRTSLQATIGLCGSRNGQFALIGIWRHFVMPRCSVFSFLYDGS